MDETFMQKLVRKCTNEPVVPIGTLATVFFLGAGLNAFKQGEKARAQYLMRGRVAAQALTVIAMGAYAFFGIKPHNRPSNVETIVVNTAAAREERNAGLAAGKAAKEARDAAAAAAAANAGAEQKTA